MQQSPNPPAQDPAGFPPLNIQSELGKQLPTSPVGATQFPGPI